MKFLLRKVCSIKNEVSRISFFHSIYVHAARDCFASTISQLAPKRVAAISLPQRTHRLSNEWSHFRIFFFLLKFSVNNCVVRDKRAIGSYVARVMPYRVLCDVWRMLLGYPQPTLHSYTCMWGEHRWDKLYGNYSTLPSHIHTRKLNNNFHYVKRQQNQAKAPTLSTVRI